MATEETLPWPMLFDGRFRRLWKPARATSRRSPRARIELLVRGKDGAPVRAKALSEAFPEHAVGPAGPQSRLVLFEGRTGPSAGTLEANEAVIAGTRRAFAEAQRWLEGHAPQAFTRLIEAGHTLELAAALEGGGDQFEVLWRSMPAELPELCESRGVNLSWTGNQSRNRFPPLYSAYNGFMLGAFLVELLGDYQRVRRQRIQDYLGELGIPLLLPKARPVYREAFGRLEHDLKRRLQLRSGDLRLYFELGIAAGGRALVQLGPKSGRRTFEDQAREAMKELDVPYSLFEEYVDKLERLVEKGYRKQAFYTLTLGFLRALLERLPADEGTCFVAMPFRGRFRLYFDTLYRPIAGNCGLAVVRAWGDLWKEDHQELLMMMIAKAEMVLADLTGLNRNVLFEVGFAFGAGRKTLLIQEGVTANPANIRMDWVYRYARDRKGWREYHARAAGLWYTALAALRAPGAVPSWQADPLEVLQLMAGVMARTGELPAKVRA
jgi:hypothetical protein